MYKVNDLEFQGHVIEIKNFNYHHWIPWPRNYTHVKFHTKIRSGRPKSRGVATTPLFANVSRNNLVVRGSMVSYAGVDLSLIQRQSDEGENNGIACLLYSPDWPGRPITFPSREVRTHFQTWVYPGLSWGWLLIPGPIISLTRFLLMFAVFHLWRLAITTLDKQGPVFFSFWCLDMAVWTFVSKY